MKCKKITDQLTALLLKMISGFRIAWPVIRDQPDDPFTGEFRGQVSHDWLDEWFTQNEVRKRLSIDSLLKSERRTIRIPALT